MSKIKELTTRESIQEAINEIDFKEIIQEKIREESEKAIKSIIEDQFRWSGPIKTQIEEEFKGIGKVDLSALGINGMSAIMSDAIVEATNMLIAQETKEVVQHHLYDRLDGYSRLNSLDSMIEKIIEHLDERDYDSDGLSSGEISVNVSTKPSYYGNYERTIVEIIHEGWNPDRSYPSEEERISFELWSDNNIWSLDKENLDVLQPLYDDLLKVKDFRLKLVKVKENTFNYYDPHEC